MPDPVLQKFLGYERVFEKMVRIGYGYRRIYETFRAAQIPIPRDFIMQQTRIRKAELATEIQLARSRTEVIPRELLTAGHPLMNTQYYYKVDWMVYDPAKAEVRDVGIYVQSNDVLRRGEAILKALEELPESQSALVKSQGARGVLTQVKFRTEL